MIKIYWQTLRLFNRNMRLFLLTAFLTGFTFDGGIYSVLFNLYLLRLDYGPEFVGIINSTGFLAFTLFSLPAGLLGRRWGSRRMMIVGLTAMAIGSGILPLAESLPHAWQTHWLTATYVIIFGGLSLYFVNAAPFIMNTTGARERDHAFSSQVALLALAAFVGSLLGGMLPGLIANLWRLPLDSPTTYRYPLLLAAILLVPAVFVMRATDSAIDRGQVAEPEEQDSSGSALPRAAFPLALIGALILIRFFQVGGMATVVTFFNVYLDVSLSVSTAAIGTISAVARLLAVPLALLTPVLIGRWGNNRIVIWASFIVAVTILPLALIPHWAAAGLGYMGTYALSMVRFPAFLAYSMKIVDADLRGTVSGVGEMAAGLSFAAVSFIGGFIITGFGYAPLFLLGSGFSALGALIFWHYFRKPRGKLLQQSLAQTG